MLGASDFVARQRQRARQCIDEAKEREAKGDLAGAANAWTEASQCLFAMAKHTSGMTDAARLNAKGRNAAKIAQRLQKGERVFATDGMKEGEHGGEDEYDRAVKELLYKSPVQWDDIGGMTEIKARLKYAMGLMIAKHPKNMKLPITSRFLLYGPPGTGKTLLAAASSNELGAKFYNVKVSSLLSKYFGESTKLISALYKHARGEADTGAAVVFIDEIESLAARRGQAGESGAERRIMSTLLAELDGLADKGERTRIITIAATNLPWQLDGALLQRFQKKILVHLPDTDARRAIFRIHLGDAGLQCAPDVTYESLADRTEGYSGRQISHVCTEAINKMIEDENGAIPSRVDNKTIKDYEIGTRPLTLADFGVAFSRQRGTPKATTQSTYDANKMDDYKRWAQEHGGEQA